MMGLATFVRPYGMALGVLSLVMVSACSGNNETPAEFDPTEIALIRVEPADGESSVPRNRGVRMTFNAAVLPESVNDQSVIIRTGGTFQTRPEGSFLILGATVEFDPKVTQTGGANAAGFPAGVQVLVEIPLKVAGDGIPANNFVQNIEGNPITIASGDNLLSFTTGAGWDDPVPGPPGVLGLEFTPGANPNGQVPPSAAVTVVFSEAVDPSSIVLGKNVFLTNNTDTAPIFQQDIPSITFFDGSLTRYTFLPVFGFGQGPFNILVNFIDPDQPDTFDPVNLPTDLGGNRIQNFTFFQTFDTQFDPSAVNTGLLREDFTSLVQRDAANTDALWGDDATFPFALVGQPITNRIQNVNITAIVGISGGFTAIDNPPTGGGIGEEDYCPNQDPMVGPDSLIGQGVPPSSAGRRTMNLYRQAELGASGTVIRVAWGPESDATFASTYPNVSVRLGHHQVGTSFSAGSFNAEFDVDGFVTVVNRVDYVVPQRFDVNGAPPDDGYLDWPALESFFDFDGINDVIVDVEAQEGTTFQTIRMFWAVNQAFGTCTCVFTFGCAANNSIGQRHVTTTFGADLPDPPNNPAFGFLNPFPGVYVMQFELAKLRSDAQSLYYDTLADAPDYLSPIINPLVQQGGATVSFTWSASADGIVEDVPFSPNIDDSDGFRFLRFHVVMRSNLFTQGRPRVELIEVPFTFDF